MKAKIQKLYVVALLLFAQALWAHDFQTNGIYYNITDSTRHAVEVTSTSPSLCAYRDTVVIPDSVLHDSVYYRVTGIGYGAFENCRLLNAVVMPNTIKYLGPQSFNSCTNLSSIAIPNSVGSIGNGAFAGCTGLTSIIIPNSVKTIGSTAFASCSRLNHVFIGDSVETIGLCAFSYCDGLDSMDVSSNNRFFTSINGMLCNYRRDTLYCCPSGKLGNVSVPSSIVCIEQQAFLSSKATVIDLPNSLVTIATDAFLHCDSLTSIVIPDSVKYIGKWNFYGCNHLKTAVVGKNVDTIDDCAFMFVGLDLLVFRKANTFLATGIDANRVLVPCGSYSWYANHFASNKIVESDYLFLLESQDSNMGAAYTLTMPTCANPVWVFYATPNNGYEFSHWSDGNTRNPRTLTLVQDTAIIACFNTSTAGPYQLTVLSNDYSKGGGHILKQASLNDPTAKCIAIAKDGYAFTHWNDGNTDNPRTLTLTSDVSLIAYFVDKVGLSEPSDDGVSVRSINGRIIVEGVANERVYVCDVLGRVLKNTIADGTATIEVPDSGVYFVKIGNRPTRKVLVLKK